MQNDNEKSTLKENTGPVVVVFAGPNGSGKTSLIDELKQSGLHTSSGQIPIPERYINPDQVAKNLPGSFPDQRSRDIAAAQAAIALRADAVAKKESFAFETVMSHPSRISELQSLKDQGYRVMLTFVTTDDPEKNVSRVKLRYDTGSTTGHYVPPDTVRSRYERTLSLLPKAAEVADATFVYDNSADFQKPAAQARYEKDTALVIAPEAKPWVAERLLQPLQQRGSELVALETAARRHGMEASQADEVKGRYEGPVVARTANFVVQHDEQTGKLRIHDRLMLDTARKAGAPEPSYALGERLDISYSADNAAAVKRATSERGATTDQARHKALAFEFQPQAETIKQYPELAGAYAAAKVMEKEARRQDFSNEQAAVVANRVRSNIADSIAKGEVPQVQIVEKREVQKAVQAPDSAQKGLERER